MGPWPKESQWPDPRLFRDANELFITNTAFRKRARDITTWTLRLKDHCIFNQIDYIICSQRTKKLCSQRTKKLCSQRTKKLCSNTQSWGGTLTPSDDKLVTLDLDLRALRELRRRQEQARSSEAETLLATHFLAHDSRYRTLHRQLLDKNLADLPQQRKIANQHWTTTLHSTLQAAKDSFGYMPLAHHTKVVVLELSCLSYEQRHLRQLIYNDHTQDGTALHTNAIDFCTESKHAAKLLLELSSTKNLPSLDSRTARLTCLKR
ncbi:unnamed protein product [Peronospora belbahrii]|uniref:Uncharacterized protein n=1 Tax=Peronospora belbahrii TaxID=622444 RepID=A0ABN8D9A7_9STRA|nr:unnamed protein product [Peronospora belbahrii]